MPKAVLHDSTVWNSVVKGKEQVRTPSALRWWHARFKGGERSAAALKTQLVKAMLRSLDHFTHQK